MSIIKEFREFAMRGNVVDLAVGVIIGAAFGKIVSSLVADIIMPPLGLLIGGIDFKQFAVTLRDAQGDIPAVVMHYGVFIQNVFDFLIVAFAIFMAIKLINKHATAKRPPWATSPRSGKRGNKSRFHKKSTPRVLHRRAVCGILKAGISPKDDLI